MNVINLFINKLDRIVTKKEVIIMAIVIIPIMIVTAVLFSERVGMKTKIALVSENVQSIPQYDKFKIEVMDKKPAVSNLLLGNYDVIVEEKSKGSYEITTVIKSKVDKEIIENFFNSGQSLDKYESKDGQRGIGTKILGFIVMIVLMQGVALTILYPEDRTLKTLRRILTAPISEKQYIFAQGVFTFTCLCIPTYLAIVVTKECFGVKVGFDLGMLAIMIGILTALSTVFALFISSVLKQNISLIASGIFFITSLLAGCYSSFTANNKVLDTICSIIPQKAYMTMIEGIEKGKGMLEFKGQLIYLIIWIATLWLLGSFITARRTKKGIY